MLLFNLLVPVVYALTIYGSYENVAKPVAKATWETSVVVYDKTVDVIKDITTDDPVESE
jgi:hypothetical protein|tara:strand:+ start:668 stop:844 length:177 start_codon:yes stop_codon:yes gene_type:complete